MTSSPIHPLVRAPSAGGRRHERMMVGFLDLLGAKGFAADLRFLNALAYTAGLQQALAESWGSAPTYGFRSTWFSDNFGASVTLTHADQEVNTRSALMLLRVLVGLQCYFLHDFGILCRGGVAVGDCFHGGGIIYGPALVKAVNLEWAADTPRIVLCEETAQVAADGPISLFAAEPLRQREGVLLPPEAPSLDFIRSEMPGVAERDAYFATLRHNVQAGYQLADEPHKAKWHWVAERLS